MQVCTRSSASLFTEENGNILRKVSHSATFVDNMIVAKLPTKPLAFYGPLKFITEFTQASHWALF
jgi:hypothetical protein